MKKINFVGKINHCLLVQYLGIKVGNNEKKIGKVESKVEKEGKKDGEEK